MRHLYKLVVVPTAWGSMCMGGTPSTAAISSPPAEIKVELLIPIDLRKVASVSCSKIRFHHPPVLGQFCQNVDRVVVVVLVVLAIVFLLLLVLLLLLRGPLAPEVPLGTGLSNFVSSYVS